MRTPSQNASFRGRVQEDPDAHPLGLPIAELIHAKLKDDGHCPTEIDNWRDCGWSIAVDVEGAQIEVVLSGTNDEEIWMLQVSCANDAGVLARLLGKKFIDRSNEVVAISRLVHSALLSHGFTDQHWRIDGFPGDDDPSAPVV